MPELIDPAMRALLNAFASEMVWAEVVISKRGNGFELRHVLDRETPPEKLKQLPVEKLREWALQTEAGMFRPLKSAPTLRPGWRAVPRDAADLGLALNQLYPGSVADWFAAQGGDPAVTHYREFTARQSGMYRITTHLTDEQVARVIRGTCGGRFCLKRRLWTVPGLEPDAPGEKSVIPCLEPCAVLLELARKEVRIEQEPKLDLGLSRSELESIVTALEFRLEHPDPSARVADFAAPDNARRLQVLLEKCRGKLEVERDASKED